MVYTTHDKPLAAPGLISYRCKSPSGGWIMIGARDAGDAMNEARRSNPAATRDRLELWDAGKGAYVPCPMTLEEFRATKTACPDIGAHLKDEVYMGRPGLLYLDTLFIETRTDEWAGSPAELHQYCLTIGRDSVSGNDLAELETRLYEFAVSEGWFNAGPASVG